MKDRPIQILAPPTEATRRRMERQRRAGTGPELALRRELWRRGLRYRIQYPVPSHRRLKIDLAFVGPRVAVFVDGCYWHFCPDHHSLPRSNTAWWTAKLTRNAERDRQTADLLIDAGWRVVRIWEHELKGAGPSTVADLVEAVVRR